MELLFELDLTSREHGVHLAPGNVHHGQLEGAERGYAGRHPVSLHLGIHHFPVH